MPPLVENSPADERVAVGRRLVACLTRDASDLAPLLASLSPVDTDALAAQAAAHGVGAVLRNRLIGLDLFDILPSVARDALDAQYRQGSAQAMARYHELGALLERLSETGIQVIALKGIYLAKAVYREPGLRPMSDMDLLFRPEDLDQVQASLMALGYSRKDMERPTSYYPPRFHQLPPFTREGATAIEVHMLIEPRSAPFAIDHEALWERARPWPEGGRRLLALAPEDLLLHLCLHAVYHHRFRIRLSALVDIALLVEQGSVDWNVLIDRARQWRAGPPVFLGIELARRLAGGRLPPGVAALLAPQKGAEAILEVAERTLLSDRPENPLQDDSLKHELASPIGQMQLLDTARTLPGWRAKLEFLLTYVFPSRAKLEQKYPRLAGSRWISIMRGLYWLVLVGRFARGMVVNRKHWSAIRRMGRS
jgi:hypothetical protein